MANNYGSLEGTMDANNTIVGAEIQFGGSSGGNGVKDVKVNGTSVVDANKIANVDLTPYAEIENVYDKQTIDTALEGKADTDDIPTELSDLTDDENHRLVTDTEKNTWDNKADESDIPTVNNPTITIQKNNQNIDSFTLNQDSNKSINITVPTKTSDLQNDNSFITNTVNNLANYYLKSDTYTQTEVNNLISAAVNGRFEKVTVLPASGEPNVIYLVPKTTALTNNVYDEYIWQDNAWELLGSTEIDLSNYVTTTDLATALADYVTSSTFNTTIANYYTKTEVGNLLDAKVDKVSGKGLSTNDYDNTAKGIVDGVTNALAGKVDKVNGKGLSTEDYTTTEKNKLAGISTGANKVESSITNGNIKIDGTETQVYDDSDIQDKIDVSLSSVSGNPLSITGLKSSQLAVNPVITFEPIQAGSGTPSPSNIRAISGYDKIEVLSCGKNLFDGDKIKIGTYSNSVWSVDSQALGTVAYDSIKYKENTSYTFSGTYQEGVANKNYRLRVVYADGSTTNIFGNNDTSAHTFTFISDAIKTISKLDVAYSSGGGTFTLTNFQIEEGNVASPVYEPYHKTTDLSESLGQTVYGGTYEPRTGLFTVTHGIFDLGNITGIYNADSHIFTCNNSTILTQAKASSTPIVTCYEGVSPANNNTAAYNKGNNTCCFRGSTFDRFYIRDDAYTDITTLASALSGQKLVYELATPFTIQLTPHEIALSQGYAYLSTNGTTIALDYHNGEMAALSDVVQLNETLERKVLRTEGHAYSTSEQIVGTWIDGKTLYERTLIYTDVSASSSSEYTIDVSSEISNLDMCINFEAIFSESNAKTIMPVVLNGQYSSYGFALAHQSGGTFLLTRGSSEITGDVILTLRYTKTTD